MSYAIRAEGLVKRYGDTVALDGVDLELRVGEVRALLGPNGAGKTTAVRILATLEQPDAGGATIGGHDLVRDRARVRELIGPPLPGAGGLDALDRLPGRPRVLLLDEPDAGLDPRARDALRDVVRRLAADGSSVLLTTQHPEEADGLADRVTVLDRGRVVAEGRPDELRHRIGEPRLWVRPTLPGDGAAVARILTELAGTAPRRDRHRVLFSVPASDPMLLSALVRRLERAGIGTEDVGLRRPGLDEVLLALTERAGACPADH
ncbi:ABC transporter ATP-binding protein [Streptomyces sp. NPDC056527]|uniref:ABC transporter ATP-binding protein n=1 Tax=Streptomyces sp. NPDC056527 TaxID=3345853 RepID=UPI00368DBD16